MSFEGYAFERVFSLPAFEGLRAIREQLLGNPHQTTDEAVAIVQAIEVDRVSLDIEAARVLLESVAHDTPNDGPHFYRGCIKPIMLAYEPVWGRSMTQGLGRFYAGLERDEQSIFRQAGILDDPPLDDFVEWWDALTGEMRLLGDAERLARGRAAERLSLDAERERLLAEGIDRRPRWIGLEDNTKGYDVLSYNRVGDEIINKLIEVKSTIASPLRFRVTRHEWDQAVRFADAYVFHVWDMQKDPPSLHVRTVEQVQPHIPSDNEKGRWKDAEIPVGAANAASIG